jgi:hypothetical protein
MSLSGVMKMKQECAKFGAFGADTLARLHVSDLQTSKVPSKKPHFSATC